MSTTLVALYKDRTTANRATQALIARGIPASRISILSHNEIENRANTTDTTPNETGAGEGAAIGAAGGVVGGVLASLALAALPGIGWILAAGPIGSLIATGAIGAGIGAVVGSVAGGLEKAGVTSRDANLYAEALRRGGSVVLLTVADKNSKIVRNTLDRFNPVDIDRTAQRWESQGWAKFDSKAAPYSAKEADRERLAFEKESNVTSETLPVIEEDVEISKVDTKAGNIVRARSYVVETPVEEELTLIEEDVEVTRHQDGRVLSRSEADKAFAGGDTTVEMTEKKEVANIDKQAKVVENVEIQKTRREQDATIRATERKTRVETSSGDSHYPAK